MFRAVTSPAYPRRRSGRGAGTRDPRLGVVRSRPVNARRERCSRPGDDGTRLERTPRALTGKVLATWLLGLGVGCLVAAIIVGTLGAEGATSWNPHHNFDWTLAGVAGTALGTVALAGFTGALAYTTAIDVRATWESVRLGRLELENRDRPTLLVVNRGLEPVESSGEQATWFAVIKNVGVVPALQVEGDVTASHFEKGDCRSEFLLTLVEPGCSVTVTVRGPEGSAGAPRHELNSYVVAVNATFRDRTLTFSWPVMDLELDWMRRREATQNDKPDA
jgi:hypothetical protein